MDRIIESKLKIIPVFKDDKVKKASELILLGQCETFFSITIHYKNWNLRAYCVWPLIKKWKGNRYAVVKIKNQYLPSRFIL